MNVEWLLPAAKEAYENRDVAMGLWQKLVTIVLGSKYKIAFIGPGGVGKSVLLDFLTGKARKDGYIAPDISRKIEIGKAKFNKSRFAFVVAPGQKSGPQIEAYSKIFDINDPVDGIVLVVGAGLVTLRDARSIDVMKSRGFNSIEEWRDHNKKLEIEYLDELCANIRNTKSHARKPKWIIVAVTKTDLIYNEIESIRNYYSSNSTSDFAARLNNVRDAVGHDNLDWEAVPLCSHLENFYWGDERLEPLLDAEARDHLLSQFVRKVEGFCR